MSSATMGAALAFYDDFLITTLLYKYTIIMIQFQNEFIVAELVNDSTAILLSWKGFVPSIKYREALEQALTVAKKHNISNWISDIRQMKVVTVADQQWAGTEWLSKAVSSGCYKNQAVIMPEDLFGQASAKNMITTATVHNQKIQFQNFSNLEAAKAWLAVPVVK
jgi:hypothetical protein